MEAISRDKRYTYADYVTWPENTRCELIDGIVYMMAPAPSEAHQDISFELSRQLGNFLVGKPCKAFHAPFDVRLNADKGDNIVLQPDLLVVCDKSKLVDGKSCNGAPDMVIEILSPSTSSKDKVEKFDKYLRAGVREYWIVDPDDRTVSVYVLKDGEYVAKTYNNENTVSVHVLEGCTINLETVFSE